MGKFSGYSIQISHDMVYFAEKPETVEPGEGQELCKVCADIANGIHFGVMTCEGCKVRSVYTYY